MEGGARIRIALCARRTHKALASSPITRRSGESGCFAFGLVLALRRRAANRNRLRDRALRRALVASRALLIPAKLREARKLLQYFNVIALGACLSTTRPRSGCCQDRVVVLPFNRARLRERNALDDAEAQVAAAQLSPAERRSERPGTGGARLRSAQRVGRGRTRA